MALVELSDGVYSGGDRKKITVVVGLDISVAFDTICQSILLDQLSIEFGISQTALDWLRSYLAGRRQFVKIGNHSSPLISCSFGVPQRSVLGPIVFAVCVSPIGEVISSHGVR